MRFQAAALCLLAAISTIGSMASAHIGFDGEFECNDSYKSGCYLLSASLAQKNMRMFFDGTVEENGAKCEYRTFRLQLELAAAAKQIGVDPRSLEISSVTYSPMGSRGRANEYRCSYVISSKRQDLRFSAHHFNRRFWTNAEEQAGICMDDVKKARAIPGSIGAAKWMSAALAQGEMCYTTYARMGLDRFGTDLNGKERVIKFGSREYDMNATGGQ